MPFEHPAPRYSGFRQGVRRFAPSAFLPALAAHTSRLDPLVADRGVRNDGRWPWAASAMARESVLYGNEHRSGGSPSERNFDKLYNVFNSTHDPEENPSVSDLITPLVYEQFGYGESEYEELSRTWALLGDTTLGIPILWDEVFGMGLAETARAAFFLHVWAVNNAGYIDLALLDAPHMQEVFERVLPRDDVTNLIRQFTTTIDGARALSAEALVVPSGRQRFAFNPFTTRPLLDLGTGGAYSPQTMLISRALFPGNLYYTGIKQWGLPFAENLGARVEKYVGRQLRLIAGDRVQGEITYKKGKKSVDWIWVTDRAVVLVECKSARMTLGARAADPSLGAIVARSLGKARQQIDQTSRLIRERHSAFQHIPVDRPVIGFVVTAEPFYLGNVKVLPEYGARGETPTYSASLRELEHLVCLSEGEAIDLLLSAIADPDKQNWSLSSVMKDVRSLEKNPILTNAWSQYSFLELNGALT